MMYKHIKTLILLAFIAPICILGCFVLSVQAGELRIVTIPPPLTDIDMNRRLTEPLAIVIDEVMQSINTQPQISRIPWKRCISDTRKGIADGIYPVSRNPKREKFLVYPKTPLWDKILVAAARKHPPVDLGPNLENAHNYTWGVGHGFSYGPKLDAFLASLPPDKVYEIDNLSRLSKMLEKRRVDIVLLDWQLIALHLSAAPDEGLDFIRNTNGSIKVFDRLPTYLAFSRKSVSQKLADRFDKALHDYILTGKYQSIFLKYFGQTPPPVTD